MDITSYYLKDREPLELDITRYYEDKEPRNWLLLYSYYLEAGEGEAGAGYYCYYLDDGEGEAVTGYY